MTSAWGLSWGAAWGNSWGSTAAALVADTHDGDLGTARDYAYWRRLKEREEQKRRRREALEAEIETIEIEEAPPGALASRPIVWVEPPRLAEARAELAALRTEIEVLAREAAVIARRRRDEEAILLLM